MNKEAIIIAGANGTGKTTFARDFQTRYPYKFINADEIAKSINPQNFNQAKLEAGKLFFNAQRRRTGIREATTGVLFRNAERKETGNINLKYTPLCVLFPSI